MTAVQCKVRVVDAVLFQRLVIPVWFFLYHVVLVSCVDHQECAVIVFFRQSECLFGEQPLFGKSVCGIWENPVRRTESASIADAVSQCDADVQRNAPAH